MIENAPLGIESAKKADLHCIGITTYLDGHYLKQADLIVRNHNELKKFLLSLNKQDIFL